MTIARKYLISLNTTRYYHVTSRVVQQQFLCGFDKLSGVSFEHRKEWVEERMQELSKAFSISVLSYGIMSNHAHQVLYCDTEHANSLSSIDVLKRWSAIGSLDDICQRYLSPKAREKLSDFDVCHVMNMVDKYRLQMTSISHYMKYLNEYIAKKANKESNRTGHFWEGRFHSQAILDIDALFNCMAYVDLNPWKAGVYDSYKTSEYTGIYYRLNNMQSGKNMTPIFKEFDISSEKIASKITVEQYEKILEQKSSRLDDQADDVETSYETGYVNRFRYAIGSSQRIKEFRQYLRKNKKGA